MGLPTWLRKSIRQRLLPVSVRFRRAWREIAWYSQGCSPQCLCGRNQQGYTTALKGNPNGSGQPTFPGYMHYGNVFDPHSPLAGATTGLLNATLVVCAFIFILVTGLVAWSLIRFHAPSADAPEPVQFRGHKSLELAWTVGPFLILVYLFVLTVHAMNASDPWQKDRPPDLVVIGHQFWWEARYPHSGAVAANEFHIPTGRKMLVRLETADVIHTFWVPQLSRKMDMIPDRANYIWLEADTPGTYLGTCSEFCGAQHAWMRIRVIAESPEEFAAWEKRQAQPAVPAATAPTEGARLFTALTCASCHAVRGRSPGQSAAPDLTHFAGRATLAAGILDNNPENLARWLKDAQAVKPGNLMPRMQLSDEQTTQLVGYLETLR